MGEIIIVGDEMYRTRYSILQYGRYVPLWYFNYQIVWFITDTTIYLVPYLSERNSRDTIYLRITYPITGDPSQIWTAEYPKNIN
jgi:hypothetical protein